MSYIAENSRFCLVIFELSEMALAIPIFRRFLKAISFLSDKNRKEVRKKRNYPSKFGIISFLMHLHLYQFSLRLHLDFTRDIK